MHIDYEFIDINCVRFAEILFFVDQKTLDTRNVIRRKVFRPKDIMLSKLTPCMLG